MNARIVYGFLLSMALVLSMTRIPAGVALAGSPVDEGPPPPVRPEPLPPWRPPHDTDFENQIVVYEGAGEQERVLPLVTAGDLPPAAHSPGSPFPVTPPMGGRFPDGFGSLTPVADPDAWPWTPHVKLFRTFPSGIVSECSGVLIDPLHVLTAGHCVWTFDSARCIPPDTACWASEIRTIPSYDNGGAPFGEAGFAMLYAWSEWTVNENYDWDIALIELDRPIGAIAGWYGYGYNDTDSYFTGNTFRNTAYPASEGYDGEEMYTWAGSFDTVQTHLLIHDEHSIGGQSGGGTYLDNVSSLITYGVLSHGRNGDTETGHVRITGDKYATIMAWISANIPGSVDLVPLDVNVSPTTYDRGDPISSFNFLLHNYSSATWSGSVTVRIYLSTNDIISTSDTQLSSLTHTGSLAGRESVRINVVPPIGTIPGTLCPASNEYWLGVVVDINDANTGNNDSSTWDAAQIWINSCDAYEPDDTSGQASRIYNGISQSHGIIPAADVDWARFTLYESSRVTLETSGSSGDTRMWLYDSGLSQIDFDDDDGDGYFSWMELTLPAGTYYVKIDEYNNNDKITSYQLSFTAQPNYGVYLPLVQRE